MLGIKVLHIADDFMAAEKGIEKTDEQVLVHLGAEQLLEAEVGIGVDVAFLVKHGPIVVVWVQR